MKKASGESPWPPNAAARGQSRGGSWPWPSQPSLARRLALMFVCVALLIFTLVGVGLSVSLRSQLDRAVRQSLKSYTEVGRVSLFHTGTLEHWQAARDHLASMVPPPYAGAQAVHFAIDSDDPRYRFDKPITGAVRRTFPDGAQRIAVNGHPDILVQDIEIPARGARPTLQLQVAVSYAQSTRIVKAFGVSLVLLYGVGTLIVLVLSYTVARIGLARLASLSREAATISPNNRSQRLSTASLPAELEALTQSFNGALERLDSSHGRLEAFNADVAHELRTPVTILIGQTEVALTRSRSVADLERTLQSNLEELGRLRDIVNNMLFLARADRGDRATELTEAGLAGEVGRTLDFLEMTLEDAGLHARLEGDALARVNTSLFGRACVNLLMNAIQHCAVGSEIVVRVMPFTPERHDARGRTDMRAESRAGHFGYLEPVGHAGHAGRPLRAGDQAQVQVTVSNPGPPIAPDALTQLFDRFYRAEQSRTNSRENHGLGLAIVKAVAEMHGGTVFAKSELGWNTFGFSVLADMQETPR